MSTHALSTITPQEVGRGSRILRDAVAISATLTNSENSTPIFDIRQTAAVGVITPSNLEGNTTITPLVAFDVAGPFVELKDGQLTLATSQAQTLADTVHPYQFLKLRTDSGNLVCAIGGKS